jgi:multicomponent Na+:H+ antiporter subunit E
LSFNRLLKDCLKRDPTGSIIIFSLLMAFWLFISGCADWQHWLTGIFVVSFLTLFWNQLFSGEQAKTKITWRQLKLFLRYFIFLLIEIVKANFAVALIVLSPKMNISPGLIVLKVTLEKDMPKAIYANSITLTPGTITVDLDGDRMLIHGMTKEHAFGVRSWYMYDIMKDIEEAGRID